MKIGRGECVSSPRRVSGRHGYPCGANRLLTNLRFPLQTNHNVAPLDPNPRYSREGTSTAVPCAAS